MSLSRLRTAALALLLLFVATPAFAKPPRVDLRVEVNPPASLFNVVDRLSDWREGDDAEPDARYEAIWERAVGPLDAADRAALADWRTLRRRYRGAPLDGGAGLVESLAGTDLPFPVPVERLRLEDKFAVLFLGARTWEELDRRAEVLLTPSDRATLRETVGHFRARLGAVLRRSLHLDAYAARIASWKMRRKPEPFLRRLGAFLHTPPDRPLDFVLHPVWLPDDAQTTRATVVENHAALEVREGLGLRGVLDVAVHELVHRLHERMPRDVRVRLERAFLEAPEASVDGSFGVAASNLFFEGLATALGQGLFAEDLFPHDFDRHRRWYEDRGYDGFAKLIAPLARPYVDAGRPMDAAFVRQVVRIYAALFDSALPPPADLLRRVVILSDDPAARAAARRAIAEAGRPRLLLDYPLADALTDAPAGTSDTPARRTLTAFPALPVVIVVADADLPRLADLPLAVDFDPKSLAANPTTLLSRPKAGPVVVARGADIAAAVKAFEMFMAYAPREK